MKKEKEVVTQEFYEDGAMKCSSQSKEKEDDGSVECLQLGCALVFIILTFFTFNKLLDARTHLLNNQDPSTHVSRR
ncbi:hypothetical protein G7B40_039950 [Aetokthonos hydrillicola Thurmond2011]|jgi:hypothetical protein|uniref:Uncharacterized protein n=1 Tax=Aetokthonos hydrillicola Thurmond2011 TaxID=2712845 RepID=A0AAP5MCU2_9CYAN|nr:hypothetical protein [Aetokthonos hydrillicola]MBW4590104.1 hypothetical protein [Aetokthonos hydrillicola CCALA 1050]MDR9900665.1 hypothetical protein [Aetokthonos hydrillicola Thurmond2011]